MSYSKYSVDPGPRDLAACIAFVTAVSELKAQSLSILEDPGSHEVRAPRPRNSLNDGMFSVSMW